MHPTHPPALPALRRLSLGCVTFGREIGGTSAHALMDLATAKGITHFDTAAQYGNGASEEIVGQWLSRRPPGSAVPVVATKISPPYTAAEIGRQVHASARRLGVPTVDLLYLHKWDPSASTEEALRALHGLVQSRRVRALGASNFTAEQLTAALRLQARLGLAPFRVLQIIHNFAVRGLDPDTAGLCAAEGIEIVTYSPLGAGFLTGKHRDGVQPGSRFHVVPAHQTVYFQPEAARRLARLEEISARSGLSQTHLALKWALHQPAVGSVLIGAREPRHLTQAFEALHCPVPCAELFADD